MNTLLASGILLGFAAGFSPGPLMTLVVTETLRHDRTAGIKVALAPLITDLPILVLSLLFLDRLAESGFVLGIVSLAGGLFVLGMGVENLRQRPLPASVESAIARPLQKGMLVNILSPHPYLFWLTVGGPLLIAAWPQNPAGAAGFVLSFYLLLVGCKVVLALIIGRMKEFLASGPYLLIMRLLGLLLCLFSVKLVYDGLTLCGVLAGSAF